MKEGQPSRTAQRVAVRRASHQLLDRPRVLEDPIALRVIGAASRRALEADPATYDRSRFSRFLRAFVAARSRYAEDRLAAARARGVRQYVLLGAGLDTFAYRDPGPAGSLRVFEVDHPATQAWKRARLAEGGVALPPHLEFVPADFERQDLEQALAASGFDRAAPAQFAWLGVTMYLTRAGFEQTLRFVAARPAGSGLVFDYALAPSSLGLLRRLIYEIVAARVRAVGEPWRTSFTPAALARLLAAQGLVEIEDLDDASINARYFGGRADGLRVGTLAHLATDAIGTPAGG